jgi:hypothetical protein
MNLNLVLKKEWFDKIKAGEKTVEYRQVTDYWMPRLYGKTFEKIIFRRGYQKNAPMMIADFIRCTIVHGLGTDLAVDENVFSIEFENVKEVVK